MKQTAQQPLSPKQYIPLMQIVCMSMLGSIAILGVLLFLYIHPVYDINLFAEIIRQPLNAILFLMGAIILLIRVPISNSAFGKILDTEKPATIDKVYPHYYSIFILRLVSAEVAVFLGFIVTMKSGEISTFVVLAMPAAISIVKEFPTLKKVREKVKLVRPRLQILD